MVKSPQQVEQTEDRKVFPTHGWTFEQQVSRDLRRVEYRGRQRFRQGRGRPLRNPGQRGNHDISGQEKVAGLAGLADAHNLLDKAVAAACGWTWPMDEDELLGKLLELNLERASEEK